MKQTEASLEEFQDIVEEYERAVRHAQRESTRLLGHFSKKMEIREISQMQQRIAKKASV